MKKTKEYTMNMPLDAELILDALWNNENWSWDGFAQYWRRKLKDVDYEEMLRLLEERK
jgi:hypothetical protein